MEQPQTTEQRERPVKQDAKNTSPLDDMQFGEPDVRIDTRQAMEDRVRADELKDQTKEAIEQWGRPVQGTYVDSVAFSELMSDEELRSQYGIRDVVTLADYDRLTEQAKEERHKFDERRKSAGFFAKLIPLGEGRSLRQQESRVAAKEREIESVQKLLFEQRKRLDNDKTQKAKTNRRNPHIPPVR